MLVSQNEYARWEQMYGDKSPGVAEKGVQESGQNRNAEGATRFAEFAEQFNHERQGSADLSVGNEAQTQDENSADSSESQEEFINAAYEKLLANRLGIDQEKMEELKEEIENTKEAIEALEGQKPLNENQQTELKSLEEKLELLEDALKKLVEQGIERNIEKEVLESRHKQLAGQYQSMQDLAQFQD